MHVTDINGIKIYNLTIGKIIPEWLSNKKKKLLIKKDEELEKRVQLIQDFEMPAVTNTVSMTKDGNYIMASGMYKPRIRCYDVKQLSMKFERCIDSEIVKLYMLSDDYSKFVCLEHDRWIEFHASYGFHFKTRLPKIGRDLDYDPISCEIYFVGNGPEVYRLNLEHGQFMSSLQTNARVINACQFNPEHRLFTLATMDGQIECWDPRAKERANLLDAKLGDLYQRHCQPFTYKVSNNFTQLQPGFSCLRYKDALRLGVGTTFGLIQLYDLRSQRPYLTKDHMYGLPIKKIEFLENVMHRTNVTGCYGSRDHLNHQSAGFDLSSNEFFPSSLEIGAHETDFTNLVATLDARCLKIWSYGDANSSSSYPTSDNATKAGKNLTCIEHENVDAMLNDFCVVPGSGMIFVAAEQPTIAAYYIPKLGPAPKWFAYLDTLTEELENEQYHDLSSNTGISVKDKRLIYDDYKFVTIDDLTHLGLNHLIGTEALRAYMHGYFIDADLYLKTKALIDPLANLDGFKSSKVAQAIAQRVTEQERLKIQEEKINVNADLAIKLSKLMGRSRKTNNNGEKLTRSGKKDAQVTSLLGDDRFSSLFKDTNYTIDPSSEEFKFVNPIITKLEKRLAVKTSNGPDFEDDNESVLSEPNLFKENDEGAGPHDLSSDENGYFFNEQHESADDEIDNNLSNANLSLKTIVEDKKSSVRIYQTALDSSPYNFHHRQIDKDNEEELELGTRLQKLKNFSTGKFQATNRNNNFKVKNKSLKTAISHRLTHKSSDISNKFSKSKHSNDRTSSTQEVEQKIVRRIVKEPKHPGVPTTKSSNKFRRKKIH